MDQTIFGPPLVVGSSGSLWCSGRAVTPWSKYCGFNSHLGYPCVEVFLGTSYLKRQGGGVTRPVFIYSQWFLQNSQSANVSQIVISCFCIISVVFFVPDSTLLSPARSICTQSLQTLADLITKKWINKCRRGVILTDSLRCFMCTKQWGKRGPESVSLKCDTVG